MAGQKKALKEQGAAYTKIAQVLAILSAIFFPASFIGNCVTLTKWGPRWKYGLIPFILLPLILLTMILLYIFDHRKKLASKSGTKGTAQTPNAITTTQNPGTTMIRDIRQSIPPAAASTSNHVRGDQHDNARDEAPQLGRGTGAVLQGQSGEGHPRRPSRADTSAKEMNSKEVQKLRMNGNWQRT